MEDQFLQIIHLGFFHELRGSSLIAVAIVPIVLKWLSGFWIGGMIQWCRL